MKKNLFGIAALLAVLPAMSLVLAGCDTGTTGNNGITAQTITVTSSSINSNGRLLTATAYEGGSNQSPQLSWSAVSGAACYAIFMVDESAGYWLHWRATNVNKTNLAQGESISGAQYKGPYPPHAYDHNYRIEVFALKQAPENEIGNFDNENNYTNMANQLNAVGGGDNIVGRGHIIGKYKNGDNNLYGNENGGSDVTVSTFEELKIAIRYGGTKTVQLAAGTYPASEGMYLPANAHITILPPASGTATIKVDAAYQFTFIGIGENATLTLGKEGAASDSLVIDGNVNRNPSNPIVGIHYENAHFIMEDGVSLINNRIFQAVSIDKGIFEMKGGKIANNRTNSWGAGVSIDEGEFIMEGGIISDNTAQLSGEGGGVSVGSSSGETRGRFTMKGGRIMRNTAGGYGGGVYVWKTGTFIMEGGTIHGNSLGDGDANKAGSTGNNGAAVYVQYGGIAKYGNGNSFPQQTNSTVTFP